ncbi:hypothetical protein J4Q44_G00262450 [Coregonus suidteri]|uniref:Uncharacterized protein n=1 Tax=Coregonus suidteri TaxID=861788 RepID=A0AAN8LHJ0_9TELE
MLGFAIEGLSKARFECDDQDDGLCDVRFWPTEPGKYAVHVTCDEDEIEDNPFMSHISPNKNKCYPHKVKVYGTGGIDEVPVNVEVVRKELGLYTCYYTPTTLAKHTICVTWGGVSVPGSPFRVKAYGPCLKGGFEGTLKWDILTGMLHLSGGFSLSGYQVCR